MFLQIYARGSRFYFFVEKYRWAPFALIYFHVVTEGRIWNSKRQVFLKYGDDKRSA